MTRQREARGTGPAVYAVMLNWNSYDFTAPCIASLKRSAYPFARIVVVDNGSKDGSIERLEAEFNDPQMLFIRNAKNEGFSGGMNIGFQAALENGAEMVFSINNDTEVDPQCLGLLVRALEENPRSGVAGPTIYYHARPDLIWQAGGDFVPMRVGISVPLKGKTARDIPAEPRDVTFLTGCAILIRASLLRTVGMLDTEYFFYGEDLDYDLRVMHGGQTLTYVPRASMWHKIDEVAKDRTSPYVLYHLARSTALLYHKRFGPPYRWYAYGIQLALYTPFRAWQILKGGAGMASLTAWVRGLLDGMNGRAAAPRI